MNSIIKSITADSRKVRLIIEVLRPIEPKPYIPTISGYYSEEKQQSWESARFHYVEDLAEIRMLHTGRIQLKIIQ